MLSDWLSRFNPETRVNYASQWKLWTEWLSRQPGWSDVTPEKMLELQENANGKGRYILLDLIQRYVREKGGTRKGMNYRYQVIRSFFLHNRCDLPRDRFDVGAGTKPSVRGSLTVEKIKRIIESAGLRDRAIFLSIWQGLMDKGRYIQFNESYGEKLSAHLKEPNGVDTPFRIDFEFGRKTNYQPYYTFIGKDALVAWKEYFEKERGYPKKGEPIALLRESKRGINKGAVRSIFETLTVRAGLKQKRNYGRTGVTIHEFRDVARSWLQLAKKDGFDETCAEFWMGHKIDPLGYNKFTELSPDYVLDNYRIAEKQLNIVSQHETVDVKKIVNEEIKQRDAEIAELRERVAKAEREKPNMDKWFEENIEQIIKKFNEYGVDMKIRNKKQT